MANKGIVKQPQKIKPTKSDIKHVEELLRPYYMNNPHVLKGMSIEDKIEKIIKKASDGYPYCPKTFIGRVKSIARVSIGTSDKWAKVDNYFNTREAKIKEALNEKEKKLYPGLSAKELRNSLPPSERKRWIEREGFYRKEFEFNDSADWALLLQVLMEELTQFRLIKTKMKDPDQNLEHELTGSYKRLNAAMKALGITREQRRDADDEREGNIADLSLKVDKKLKKMEAIHEADIAEETEFMEKRKDTSILTRLPEDLRDIVRTSMESVDY